MIRNTTRHHNAALTRIFLSFSSVDFTFISFPLSFPVTISVPGGTGSGAHRHGPWTLSGMSQCVGGSEVEHLFYAVDGGREEIGARLGLPIQ